MLQLRILGEVDLRAPDGRRLESVLAQPKRLALLSVLALADGALPRDELIGLFWPELPEDRARRALSQALHYLRRSLGPNIVEGMYETGIGLAENRLSCDAAALVEASEGGRLEQAVELYRGELLPGFHLDDGSAAFESWLMTQRARVQDAAAQAAWATADAAAAEGDAVRAANLAGQAYELSPWGEPALYRLLKVLGDVGDRSGARRAYRAFAARLRTEFGAEPSAELQDRMAAVEDRNGASAAMSTDRPPSPEADPEPVGAIEAAGSPPDEPWTGGIAAVSGRGHTLKALLTAAVIAGVFIVTVPWQSSASAAGADRGTAAPTPEGAATIYLSPVRDLAFPDPSPGLAEAVTGELMAELIKTRGYRVVGTGDDVGDPEGLEVRSTLRRDGDHVRLAALLIDPVSQAVLDHVVITSERPLDLAMPGWLAGRMASEIRKRLGGHIYLSRLADLGASPEALEGLRLAARELDVADSLRLSGAREAAMLAFASADSLLRGVQRQAPDWQEAVLRRAEVALRAVWLHLVPPHQDLEEAHARVLKGLAVAESAVEGDAGTPRALETRGVLRYWAGVTALNHATQLAYWADARDDLEQVVRSNPGNARAWNTLSLIAEQRGQYAEAYHSARRAYAADRDLRNERNILTRLFTSALEVGDMAGGATWCAETHEALPDYWLGSYCDLLHLAWAGPWSEAAADSLIAEARSTLNGEPYAAYVVPRLNLLRAVVLARAGKRKAAEAALSETGSARASPELLGLRAWAETVLGREVDARSTLRELAQLKPGAADMVLRSRRFEDLGYTIVRGDY